MAKVKTASQNNTYLFTVPDATLLRCLAGIQKSDPRGGGYKSQPENVYYTDLGVITAIIELKYVNGTDKDLAKEIYSRSVAITDAMEEMKDRYLNKIGYTHFDSSYTDIVRIDDMLTSDVDKSRLIKHIVSEIKERHCPTKPKR